MNLHFSGGADEIGASSTPIEIDGCRILVDAGIRMDSDQDSQLPDFSQFDKVGMPDAVLLTHAHTDHTGALLALHRMLPAGVKVSCTPPTKAITQILLEDSVKRMEQYTLDDVSAVLRRMELVPWLEPVQIGEDMTAKWIPAGHILGAAMIYIETKRESVLMTGDVSVTNQRTISGLVVPSWCKPDVMVMESTYGDRQHKDRTQEEKKFVEDVAETIAAGGKVLIPTFAVGRSQEVILILKRAMEHKQIPEFPVYVDGMVQDVNDVYKCFSDELPQELQRKAERGEDIFYSEFIKPVNKGTDRDSVASWEPCCIIASSGMLKGGRSSQYARHLASDTKNLIAITGYQAKGTPGSVLLDLAKAKESTDRTCKLNDGEPVPLECRVERYSFSAHADSNQLIGLVKAVQPRKLFLVHGNTRERRELSKSLREKFPTIDVILPKNHMMYPVRKQAGIARGRQLNNYRILSEISAFVRKMKLKGPFRVRELAEIWFGTEATTLRSVEFFELCLSWCPMFFVPDRRSSDLFRLR